MTKASYRHVYGKTTGDIFISDGIAPSAYFLPDETLPTLWYHSADDVRYEVLIPKGTIVTTYTESADGGSVPSLRYCTTAGYPIGVAQYHLFRPFDKGTSQGAGWIRRGYIKYPFIPAILTPGLVSSPVDETTDSIKPSDFVKSDDLGRFTFWKEGTDSPMKVVGQVIDIQKFGVTYDTQLMEFLKFETDLFQGKFNTLTAERPYLASADYVTMFETGITNTYADEPGIDDALDRFGAQGMITIALML
jgi:hypothetical protein